MNREEIGLRSFFDFETRQLLFTRLELYSYWPMVLFGGMTILFVAYPLARVCDLEVSRWVDVAFVAFFLATWGGVLGLGVAVRGVLRAAVSVWGGGERAAGDTRSCQRSCSRCCIWGRF